jgi:RNA polymerase sigma-70 factor (ECF subfamily)
MNPSPEATPGATPEGALDSGASLMVAWQGGDESAFERLVAEYSGPVFGLLTRFLGTHPGREDMVQDVFLRVVRAKDRYEPTARFTTWLYRIAYNMAVNETQRRGGRKPASLSGSGDEGMAPPDPVDEKVDMPLDALQRGDTVSAVREAIADLPENQRMALVLAKYEDMPYAEIAGVLHSSEKAIKSLIHRARETLRVRLAPLLAQEPA